MSGGGHRVDFWSKCKKTSNLVQKSGNHQLLVKDVESIDFRSKTWKISFSGLNCGKHRFWVKKKLKTSILGQKSGKHRFWVKKVENIDFGSKVENIDFRSKKVEPIDFGSKK